MPTPAILPDPLFLSFQQALAGRYSIDREIGRGGMGVVYLAREVGLDRLVAIKLLPPDLAERTEPRERFLREARLAAKLSHPNIVPIHAVEQADGFVYFVMGYVAGETLAQRVAARGPVAASEGARLLREVAWALGYAHAQGLVHRDVKPDNILIEGASGRAVVVDFGIAATMEDASFEMAVSGTPEFMSPEQALGRTLDARSDLYSLGVTAFYALSGRLPFEGASAAEVLARQVSEAPQALADAGATVPRKLAALVDRLLAKNPAHRPESAVALAEQLGVAIELRRELPAALRAFVKRNGRMDGGGTVLALVGSLVAGVTTAAMAGATPGALVLVGSVAVAPVVFGVFAARRLLDLGFAHADLGPAFRAERESSREERTIGRHRMRGAIEWTLRAASRVAGATSMLLVPIAVAAGTAQVDTLAPLAITLLSVTAASMLAYLGVVGLRRDVDIEFWNAVWTGRFGMLAFHMAKGWRGARPTASAMTHRATELSLGMAAEELFAGLPKASRESLRELPSLLRRLQHDAHTLRARLDGVHEALAQASGAAPAEAYESAREEREVLSGRLRETVGALETIRLSLLRLHAGSLSLESFTTHIALAAEATADVERLAAAHLEVQVALAIPSAIQLTPA
ncbi:MAG TPA: serine/threonine-protein kinase [Gemmatimonas sp.]|nr:serine/threonine-protein kinase [Gemmatimonas sp.]